MEHIVVIGGGIAGLATALSLKHSRREVLIVERDPAPPDLGPEEAFTQWKRPGVPQFRHAHMFVGRLQMQLRQNHPELFAELLDAGLELAKLDEVLPEHHLGSFPAQPGDSDLLHLWGRRPTFEYVLRRHAGRLPNVGFVHDTKVERLLAETEGDQVRVRGVEVSRGGRRESLHASLVVDASGKRTPFSEQLRALGIELAEQRLPTGRTYVCRHYRLHPASEPPLRQGTGANLDYFGYATFYAEHGHYAITLSCPDEEQELARAMSRAPGFDAICARIPAIAAWVQKSEPVTRVLGAGDFGNRWTRYAVGKRRLSGFFAVGDSHIETNPMYGRGCATAFLQAQTLAQVLEASEDPVERARRYAGQVRAALEQPFEFCVGADNLFRTRARLSRGEPISAGERFLKYAYDEAWTPALRRSPLCAREMIRAMEMHEVSPLNVRLGMVGQIVLAWCLGRVGRVPLPSLREAPRLPGRRAFIQEICEARDSEPARRLGASSLEAALPETPTRKRSTA